jgi:hypothetical protein
VGLETDGLFHGKIGGESQSKKAEPVMSLSGLNQSQIKMIRGMARALSHRNVEAK